MEKIFSKVNPNILLHVVHREEDFSEPRLELSPQDQYMQAVGMILNEGREVPAHKHLESDKISKITQEAVIVIDGLLEAEYYDLDDSLIKKIVLKKGDCSVTFRGGHSFKSLTNNTKIYELKNGPYYGREKDKVGI
ncbi:MAG: hypothetical protein ABSG05_01930 [Candidatus Pacearchaeota archaeon]|jgi:hypothetical protein